MDIELRSIKKVFPGVIANEDVDLTARGGQVHALLGENGAGKSTLMNVLYGLYRPDGGEILIDGRPVTFGSPADAIAAGIGMVHQHFMLVPVFTVAENLMLGNESTGALGVLDRGAARDRIVELSEQYGLRVDPDAVVEDLPVGVQQRVEILKALYRDADCLILDEPTAVLTPDEIEDLERVIGELRDRGKAVIFITHKLGEVLRTADQISVLRRGRVVGTTTPAETDQGRLASMMVGRDVQLVVDKTPSTPAAPMLAATGLVVRDARNQVIVDHVDLTVRRGEIVALAGVQGNGQTELIEAICGMHPLEAGHVELDGWNITGARADRLFRLGVGHIPEDRQRDGMVGPFSVADNLILNLYRVAPFAKGLVQDRAAIADNAEVQVEAFDVRTSSIDAPIATLSGGNQQKVIVAREFTHAERLLIASQPTRGLDVGSIQYIHRRIVEHRDAGAAVLLVSSELDEVLALADRIAVMYEGRILATLDRADADRDRIGLLMAGRDTEGTAA